MGGWAFGDAYRGLNEYPYYIVFGDPLYCNVYNHYSMMCHNTLF